MADLTDNSGIVTDNDTITVTCTLKLTNDESGEVVSRFAAVSPIRPDAAFVSNGLIAELFLDKTGTALAQTTNEFYTSVEWTVTDDSTSSDFTGDPPPPSSEEEETGPFEINSYYPLYNTIEGAVSASPDPTSIRSGETTEGYHIHVFSDTEYYMPNGLEMGVTQFHGDYPPPSSEEEETVDNNEDDIENEENISHFPDDYIE